MLGNSSSSGGESVLTYTWMLAGTNPSTNVTFANNGTQAAANTTATFRGPGTYHIQARIRDTVTQLAADSNPLDVTVVRDAKRIVVGPQNQVYTIGQVQPLNISATITDQWGLEMTLNPTWRTSAGSLACRADNFQVIRRAQ